MHESHGCVVLPPAANVRRTSSELDATVGLRSKDRRIDDFKAELKNKDEEYIKMLKQRSPESAKANAGRACVFTVPGDHLSQRPFPAAAEAECGHHYPHLEDAGAVSRTQTTLRERARPSWPL